MTNGTEHAAAWLILVFLLAVLVAMSLRPANVMEHGKPPQSTGGGAVAVPSEIPTERLDRHEFEDRPIEDGALAPATEAMPPRRRVNPTLASTSYVCGLPVARGTDGVVDGAAA